ncbi:MAG: prepilin-type N-terminal cleavage/methylation domain-containing protein [Acidobacteria bacterium]|nr:prepilin-type N-terminal cleavage/methylation domain-containing protein [Acidobacteriota bacterium]
MRNAASRPPDGFTLIEVLIALNLVTIALSVVGALLGLSIRASEEARARTIAALLARQKLESLRSSPAPLALAPGALDSNVAGFFDVVDSSGQPFASGSNVPFAGLYVRRWTGDLVAVTGVPLETVTVLVMPAVSADGQVSRRGSSVQLSTVRLPR